MSDHSTSEAFLKFVEFFNVLSKEALEVILIDADTEMCFPHHKAKALAALGSKAAPPKNPKV